MGDIDPTQLDPYAHYTIAMLCICGGQLIEIDVRGRDVLQRRDEFRLEHQGEGHGEPPPEEARLRYIAWYENWKKWHDSLPEEARCDCD